MQRSCGRHLQCLAIGRGNLSAVAPQSHLRLLPTLDASWAFPAIAYGPSGSTMWGGCCLAGFHGGLEIGQMMLKRRNASDQHAVALVEVSDPVFKGDEAPGVGDAHGLILSSSAREVIW